MNTRDLARIDLNLLISLQVLLQEKSVSKAAERLFITQPAMSKTLSRLRDLFDDPLFTRSSHGMRPTPRAQELAADLGEILAGVVRLVKGAQFDPREFSGEITLALSEYIGVTLLPELTLRLNKQAPQLNIRVITRVENQLHELSLGNLDFAIHIEQSHYSTDFKVQPLGGSPPVILVRDNHPLAHAEVSLQQLAGYPIIRLYVSDWEQAEIQSRSAMFNGILDSRRGSLEISHLLTALEVLRGTDYFMPGPAYILQNEGATRGIYALPVPPGEDYVINYVLVAHKRTANSPLHNWLWQEITATIRELRTPLPRKVRQRVAASSTDRPH